MPAPPSSSASSASTPDAATRRYSIASRVLTQKTKSEDDASPGTCVFAVEYPEIVGLADAALTKRINALVHPDMFDGDCLGPSTIDGKFDVTFQGENVLSLETNVAVNIFGAAHPSSDHGTFNISLSTGKQIPLENVLTPSGKKALPKLLLPQVKADMKSIEPHMSQADLDIVMDAFGGSYLLEANGIRFFPDLPQAFAAIGAGGFLLKYEALAPYLSDKSEAREAWTK